MKSIHILLLLCVSLLLSVPSVARTEKSDTLSTTYTRFTAQKGMIIHKGYYNVYQLGEQYYLEIPKIGLNKDVFISAQVVRGSSSYISDASGVIMFSKGKGNNLYVTRHYSLDIAADTTDVCMMNAIHKSGMVPIDAVYPIVTMGPSDSYIIDISKDLNTPNGLFNVATFSMLSHPDPMASGVDGIRTIQNGVLFQLTRSQVDNIQVNQDGKKADAAYTFGLEFIIQQLPERNLTMREAKPAFGFETVSRTEYDTKKFLAIKKEYIQRWSFTASKSQLAKQRRGIAIQPDNQICVYIDPITPKPFVESIRNSIAQWSNALLQAGWKNVFHFSSDGKDSSLSYHHLLFRWGLAYDDLHINKVIDDLTGEIIAVRIDLVDMPVSDILPAYFLQCSNVDKRISTDLNNLEVRKDVLTSMIAATIGKAFALKSNKSGYTAFTLQQLRSNNWLKQYGPTASITSGISFNYLASPEDGIDPDNLMPKVSIYDKEAICYAYGNGNDIPSMKNMFYTGEDKANPYQGKDFLSSNLYQAGIEGIANIKEVYTGLDKRVSNLQGDQNSWTNLKNLAVKALALYQTYIAQINSLVGGRMIHPIIKGVSEQLVTYVPREQQIQALKYMEENIFHGIPKWVMHKELQEATTYNHSEMMMGIAVETFKHYFSKEVVQSLIDDETANGAKAFTAKELFNYIDRVIFENFNNTKPVPEYKQNLQSSFIYYLTSAVAQNSISAGLSNEANGVIFNYFLNTANKIIVLSKTHTDKKTRNNYELIVMRMNKDFFNK